MSMNTKKLKKNAFRVTKKRNVTALRLRIPGGHLETKYFDIIKQVADKYGNGTVHITIRQGFEIPEIPFDKIQEVNEFITPLIKGIEIEHGVDIKEANKGYPAAGTRNVSACIGNRVCPFANYDTTSLAIKIEKEVFPHDRHVKIALTGCPNDCIKAHLQDFGVIGMVEPQYENYRCVGCEACVKNCQKRVTGALTMENYKVNRDPLRCIGCGECILVCPTSAQTRSKEKYYRLVIMGRTGKKNPRLAANFLEWVDEKTIIQVIKNVYEYIDKFIICKSAKEHIGYIVDRTGYQVYKEYVLKDIALPPKAKVAEFLNFVGYQYDRHSSMSCL